jgi:hypothetical protein
MPAMGNSYMCLLGLGLTLALLLEAQCLGLGFIPFAQCFFNYLGI